MEDPISCNNCISQFVCKAYLDCNDMIKTFNQINGKIAKIPFKAEILATQCKHFISPSDMKTDLLEKRNRVKTSPEDKDYI